MIEGSSPFCPHFQPRGLEGTELLHIISIGSFALTENDLVAILDHGNSHPELLLVTTLVSVGRAILDDGSSHTGLGHMAQMTLAWAGAIMGDEHYFLRCKNT